ncbi:MAG TPA: hypothetical protein VM621_08185 [Luteibacter sp.]|uniref:hypothetical protein n=1 Tax=Luteibacter sp. TaxID=1886636 RepID=UPI002C23F635|nr:hypothetical protein [Luteibacter sp.]HVI55015.1 hypothetical protein [Luteibacter sp.]
MKTWTALSTLIAMTLSATAANASTWDASTSLDRFDEQIARGLPQPAFQIGASDEAGVATNALLAVESMLDTPVELPDGSVMTTYTGSWNGVPATISRGDGQLLVDLDAVTDANAPQAVASFDLAVATALPAHVHLGEPAIASPHVADDNDDLVVSGELGGDIRFADGSHGRMYDATWHGVPVVATRSGNRLDITSQSTTGIDITGFTAGSIRVEHENLPGGNVSNDASVPLGASTVAAPRPRVRRSSKIELVPNRLTFHLMLHDDVGHLSSQHIHAGYVAWWLADLLRNVVRGERVDVLYSQGMRGVTDLPYQYIGSLYNWSDAVRNFAYENRIPRTYKHKYLLIVNGMPEPGLYGRSWQKGSEGIASIGGRYPEIAHQLGHLLGATHANAEVRYSGWWCETNMIAPSLALRSNCYGYSAANMRLINDYAKTGVGFVADRRLSDDR